MFDRTLIDTKFVLNVLVDVYFYKKKKDQKMTCTLLKKKKSRVVQLYIGPLICM